MARAKNSKKYLHLYKTRFYNIWDSMKRRSTNPNHRDYPRYGGAGRGLDGDGWSQFDNFADDMYKSYEVHFKEHGKDTSLDRIDNDKGYSIENCRWATQSLQVRNSARARWITVDGETLILSEWADRLGIPHQMIQGRLKDGWSEERAVTTPSLGRHHGCNQFKKSIETIINESS